MNMNIYIYPTLFSKNDFLCFFVKTKQFPTFSISTHCPPRAVEVPLESGLNHQAALAISLCLSPVLKAKPPALRFRRRADIRTFVGVLFTCMNIIVTACSVLPGARRPLLRGVNRSSHALVVLCLRYLSSRIFCRMFCYLASL